VVYFNLRDLHLGPPSGVTVTPLRILPRPLASKKQESRGYHVALFAWSRV